MTSKFAIGMLALGVAALSPSTRAEDNGLPPLDLREVLKRTLRAGTRVAVSDGTAGAANAGAAANQIRLSRNEPIRVKGAKPSRIDFVFVVNEAKPPPDGRPTDGIVPVINEHVVRAIDQMRDQWTERARGNVAREFGANVPVRFEETLYGDLQTHESERLKREGYEEKARIPVPGETVKMRLFVKEHYDAKSSRDVRIEATIAFAPKLADNPDPDALGVFLGARLAGPLAKTVATGNLAELDPEHLQQFERRVNADVEFAVNWFNKEPLRRISLQQLEEARAANTAVSNPLRYPWFGERRSITVASTPPPRSALGDRDFSEDWPTQR